MKGLAALPVRRPVAVIMASAAALVFGLVSYAKLPLSLFPELSYPTLTVRASYPGAAPEEVEEAIIRPIEELVATVDGLVRMRSIARSGTGDVVLEFGWGRSMVTAAQDVRERLDLLRLPEEVTRPLLLRYDPTLDPVLRLGLRVEPGGMDQGELRDYADRVLRADLERLSGVAAVTVAGGEQREVSVALDSARLAALGLSARDVEARLRAENVNVAGGDLSDGDIRYLVRTLHELRSLDAIRDLVVTRRGDALVRLGDVATVQLGAQPVTHLTRFLGEPGVELAVYKEADVNLVTVARLVKRNLRLDENAATARARVSSRPRLPQGISAVLLTDQSQFIAAAIGEVRSAAVVGGLLAMLILYLFLRRARTTLIAAVAIPVSVCVAFAPLYLGDVSLNVMSLGGLALGVGMLVDNAVVVLEAIARRREQGETLASATVEGVREVGGAVTAATMTTVVVFAPLVFVEGVAGQVFGDLAQAVVYALLASLAVALTLIPTLSAQQGIATDPARADRAGPRHMLRRYWLGVRAAFRFEPGSVWRWLLLPYRLLRGVVYAVFGALGLLIYLLMGAAAAAVGLLLRLGARLESGSSKHWHQRFDRVYQYLERALLGVLTRSLARPSLVLMPAVLITLGALALLPTLGSSLVPEVHRGVFDVRVTLPVGTPLAETARLVQPIEAALAAHPEVELVSSFIGVSDDVWRQSAEGEHTAELRVRLRPGINTARREEQVMAAARDQLANLPGAHGQLQRPSLFTFAAPIEVIISGPVLETLHRAAARVTRRVVQLSTLTDVETTVLQGFPEIRVRLREAALAQLGLQADQVARAIRDQVQGRPASVFRPRHSAGEQLEIVLRGDLGPLPSAQDLAGLVVGYAGEVAIPLAAIADLELGAGPVDVRHVDGARAVVIEAGLAPDVDLAAAVTQVNQAVAELVLPPGVIVDVAGQDIERRQSMRSLWLALLLAAFLVYAVLAAQLESFVHPWLIMATVPLGLVGAVLGLAITGTPVSILVFVGAITLVGIVVNNAIVLFDRVRRERMNHAGVERALLTAVRVRLRPILMTTITTIVGLLPLALSRGEGAEIRAPIAITLIFGLSVSTLLTLLVAPVLYRLVTPDDPPGVEPSA